MSIHIGANKGDIAETILLPGDPLRAKWIAETFLDNPICFNEVRGMLGYTGTYQGKRVSVMGTGMGIPSISIYAHELINDYGVKNLIRVGSCGAIQKDLKLRDLIFALSASSTSNFNTKRFNNGSYSPTVNFELLNKAINIANTKAISFTAGNVLTNDLFYADNPDDYKKWADYGVLCMEMETAALYTIAAKHNVKALTILTVSDSLITNEETTSKERETTFKDMIEIALGVA